MPNTTYIDEQLRRMLHDAEGFSQLNTCLGIRLSDYAAQLCGCRSTRQISDGVVDDVELEFFSLINRLHDNIAECLSYLDSNHVYNNKVVSFNNSQLESYLEDVLYYMTIENYTPHFCESFFGASI